MIIIKLFLVSVITLWVHFFPFSNYIVSSFSSVLSIFQFCPSHENIWLKLFSNDSYSMIKAFTDIILVQILLFFFLFSETWDRYLQIGAWYIDIITANVRKWYWSFHPQSANFDTRIQFTICIGTKFCKWNLRQKVLDQSGQNQSFITNCYYMSLPLIHESTWPH